MLQTFKLEVFGGSTKRKLVEDFPLSHRPYSVTKTGDGDVSSILRLQANVLIGENERYRETNRITMFVVYRCQAILTLRYPTFFPEAPRNSPEHYSVRFLKLLFRYTDFLGTLCFWQSFSNEVNSI